jgi:extracellular factor (EF) 3-hydroxypalmitic acid methyl ester biosynthesis protein
MSLSKQIIGEIEEFKVFVQSAGSIPESEFDDEFHSRLWNIEKLALLEPDNRKSLMAEFLSATTTELEIGLLCHHSRTKPLGYAGDHILIDMIYQQSVADTDTGKLLDDFFHRQKAPTAVRNRKSFFINTFVELCKKKQSPSILDIACGPCRDVAEAFEEAGELAGGVSFHCVDMDPRAIEYAQSVVQTGRATQICWQATDVFRLRTRKKHDLVWSAGLFDYLNDRLAAALLRKMWDATIEGGEVIVGNFHISNPDRAWMEWCGDWHLIHRNEDDMRYLCHRAGLPTDSIRFHYEPTGINMFLRLAKN